MNINIEKIIPYLKVAKAAKNIGKIKNVINNLDEENDGYFSIELLNGKIDIIKLQNNMINLYQDVHGEINERMGYNNMSLDEFKNYVINQNNKKENILENKAINELTNLLEQISNKKIVLEEQKLNEFFNKNEYNELLKNLDLAFNITEELKLKSSQNWQGNEIEKIQEKLKNIFHYFTKGGGPKKKNIIDKANDFLNSNIYSESEKINEWFGTNKYDKLLKILNNCMEQANDLHDIVKNNKKELIIDAKEILVKIKKIWKNFNLISGISKNSKTKFNDPVNRMSAKNYIKQQELNKKQNINNTIDKKTSSDIPVKSNQIKNTTNNFGNSIKNTVNKVGNSIKNTAKNLGNKFIDSLREDPTEYEMNRNIPEEDEDEKLWKDEVNNDLKNKVKESYTHENNKNFKVDKSYTHFAIRKSNNKIITGWDYKGLDKEEIIHYSKIDLKDLFPETKLSEFLILSLNTLNKKNINPFDWNNWEKNI